MTCNFACMLPGSILLREPRRFLNFQCLFYLQGQFCLIFQLRSYNFKNPQGVSKSMFFRQYSCQISCYSHYFSWLQERVVVQRGGVSSFNLVNPVFFHLYNIRQLLFILIRISIVRKFNYHSHRIVPDILRWCDG